jgi:hypothetical protein
MPNRVRVIRCVRIDVLLSAIRSTLSAGAPRNEAEIQQHQALTAIKDAEARRSLNLPTLH